MMGGCRCAFRDCEVSTSSMPGTHFFHFPVRMPARCEMWAKYADKMNFLEFPDDKLKNKVICQHHFHDNCFMNYKKESLTKTAVPTLLQLTPNIQIDFENDSEEEVARKIAETQAVKAAVAIRVKRPSADPVSKPVEKKTRLIKTEMVLPDLTSNVEEEILYNEEPVILNEVPARKLLRKNGSQTSTIIIKPVSNPEPQFMNLSHDVLNLKPMQKLLNDQTAEIQDLKQMLFQTMALVQKQSDSSSSDKFGSPSEIKSDRNMTKIQLFNSIKRYLNPTMVTMLRMEMFGGSDRDWKKDEMDFAMELKNLGDNVYEYMTDEWRFRLPSQKELNLWAQEHTVNDEDC